MLQYWSIEDIKNKILSPEVKIGEYYICDDRVDENELIIFIITEITNEHYGWKIIKVHNKFTGEIKVLEGGFGSVGRINKKSFHRQLKNGIYKKSDGYGLQ